MSTAAHEVRATAADRAEWIAEAVHSVRMEGLDVTPAWEADAAQVIDGRIDADELVRRTRARYGLEG